MKNKRLKVLPSHPCLQYMGRIDFEKPDEPVFVFPCTFVKIKFTGTFCLAELTNYRSCWGNYMAVLVDGVQSKFLLPQQGKDVFVLAEGLEKGEHEICLFKRQDACHYVRFHGFYVDEDAVIHELPPLPHRRMEVYGDSVSAGEVSEAIEYVGVEDPEHDGEYSNSYYSYSWLTAMRCNAQLHNISQGGIALLDHTGYFGAPDYKGILSTYDKIQYHLDLGALKQWDFQKYTPHVVIVAIGQNDAHPKNYMEEDYYGEKAVYWRKNYESFIRTLRKRYPNAHIILKTTILEHHPNWDKAIDQVWEGFADEKVHRFRYTNNGTGTKGHIRKPEAEKMAEELSAFIEPFFGR